jgi:hypothetical protein
MHGRSPRVACWSTVGDSNVVQQEFSAPGSESQTVAVGRAVNHQNATTERDHHARSPDDVMRAHQVGS